MANPFSGQAMKGPRANSPDVDENNGPHSHNRDRDSGDRSNITLADELEQSKLDRNRVTLAQSLDCAAPDQQPAKSSDERRNIRVCSQCALQSPNTGTHNNGRCK